MDICHLDGDYANLNGLGYATIPLNMLDVVGTTELELFYAMDGSEDFTLACRIPIELK